MSLVDRAIAFRSAIEERIGTDRPVPPVPRDHDIALPDALAVGPIARGFVWACVVATIDPLMYPHLVTLGGVDARRGLSPATYAAMIGIPQEEAIALANWLVSEPTLVRFGLLSTSAPGLLPIATPYRASARLVGQLRGDVALDAIVARHGCLVAPRATVRRDDPQRAAVDLIRRALGHGDVIVVDGPRGVGRRTALAEAAGAGGVLAIDGGRLAEHELDAVARATCADALLRGAVPVLADLDRISGDAAFVAKIVARIVDEMPGPIALTTSTPGLELPSDRDLRRVTMPIADVATRVELWADALGASAPAIEDLRDIALRHKLGAGPIARAASAARRAAAPDATLTRSQLIEGIRDTLADRFGALVERLTVTYSWDDVVLPQETLDQVRALTARAIHAWTVLEDWGFPRQTARGGGIAALLSGPPGTGKTMVAGLIARELGRDLYRVDLSQIISKWVGETEKQLGQVFDAAESGNALLLFDEADSLFAKRTEVKSSSDRYANLEVNYLLQRIETFSGMTILTTNLDTSIDPALRRRLAAHVVFWPPEAVERTMLWQRFLATRAPIEGELDHGELADEYPDMTGANIRNAALAAAFLAARERGPITMDRVHRAARAEYRAMGRVLAGRR